LHFFELPQMGTISRRILLNGQSFPPVGPTYEVLLFIPDFVDWEALLGGSSDVSHPSY
jgi:hypothetical protein